MNIEKTESDLFIRLLKDKANEYEKLYYSIDDFGDYRYDRGARKTILKNKKFFEEKYYLLRQQFKKEYDIKI